VRLRRQYFKNTSRVVVHDAGCGYGAFVSKLNTLGFDATGSDVDGESVEQARRRGNNRVYQGHFTEIPSIAPDGVDILTCYHSLEHYPDPLKFFDTVKRALRPGGLFIMSLPNGAYLPARVDYFEKFDWCFYPGHLQYFTPRSAEVLLAKAGLRSIEAFSYDWDGTQEGWLLDIASRLPVFRAVPRESLLMHLAAKTVTRDLRVVAINDESGSSPKSFQHEVRSLSKFFDNRVGSKVLRSPNQDAGLEILSDATCNEFIDDGISIVGYQMSRRDGECFLSLRLTTNHLLMNDYVMVLHMEDLDNGGETFVNLDFAPCPPTTEWQPFKPITVVRQLVFPAAIEFRPEKAVNFVRQPALPAGKYAIRVGLWDLEKGLIGRLARLGPVILPDT
jgi:SAM-dependent methyltransferase